MTPGFRLLVAGCGLLLAACRSSVPGGAPPVSHDPQPATRPPQPEIRNPQPARLRIIGTNDFHGGLEARPDTDGVVRGGGAYMAAVIRKAERECQQPECITILVDGGDMFQGTAASNLVHGRSVVELYNYLGYSAAALGNHELDWGQDTLRALMRAARYPILAANVRDPSGRDVPWIPNDTIIQRGPFKVGIIGVIRRETATTAFPENVAGLDFVDAVPIIDSISPALRARGADFVIIIGHIGARCNANGQNCREEAVDITRRVRAKIDAVISGHSHTLVNTEVNGIPLVQARLSGRAVDVVDLYMSGAPSRHEVREVYPDSIAPEPNALAIVTAARRQVDAIEPRINRPVATIARTIADTGVQAPLGHLIADGMRVVGGGDVAVVNNGGIRTSMHAGTATYGSLFEILPFGNKLMRVRVRGSDLRAYFARALASGRPDMHVSGARIVYHGGPTPGLDTVTVLGKPLDDQAIYTVVINDFMASGGDRLGFGPAAISTTATGVVDLDAFVAYLASLPQPVPEPVEPRLIRKP
jgi:2',3'-cyclic-nucleotide 2'-phosphodiesterase (5'-nucleotidase family)